jgi:hypothetical protein
VILNREVAAQYEFELTKISKPAPCRALCGALWIYDGTDGSDSRWGEDSKHSNAGIDQLDLGRFPKPHV